MALGDISTQWFRPGSGQRAGQEAAAADLAARLPHLVARAHEIATSVIHGLHGRRRAGAGETFWQFRPFAAGESAHRIDWRRSARSDQLYVRDREWEAAHSFFLWMDGSPSMAFKSSLAADYKQDRAALIGLALAEILVDGGERVGALGLTAPLSARNIIDRLAGALAEHADFNAKQEIPPAAALPPRAKLVLISDFLCDPAALAARLEDFASSGAVGAMLMVVDPSEESFPFAGETVFVDTDGGSPFHAGEARSLREAYARRLAEHRAAIEAAARRASFLFLLHHTDHPASEAALALAVGVSEGLEPVELRNGGEQKLA
jgi:uncharacterized protein (DUF58 family)